MGTEEENRWKGFFFGRGGEMNVCGSFFFFFFYIIRNALLHYLKYICVIKRAQE